MNAAYTPRLGFGNQFQQTASNQAYMTLDQLVAEVAKRLHAQPVKKGNLYDLDVPTKPGRAQHVIITVVPSPPGTGAKNMLYYYSVVGKIPPDLYKRALEMNMQVPFGAFALLNNDLVMVDTQILECVQIEEMLHSISSLAVYADQAEEEILKVDKA